MLVATVLTACGIETINGRKEDCENTTKLQQYLPLAVLKLNIINELIVAFTRVATVLTACGIETRYIPFAKESTSNQVATVLTACGIETETC